MNERTPIDSEAVLPSTGRDSVMMLYDWFKHMTTLSLVTLGGILGILQGGDANVKQGVLAGIISAVALAGILGLDGLNRLLAAELEGKPLPRALYWSRRLAALSYGLGVGAFLALIVETVS